MSSTLLEQFIRLQVAVHEYASNMRERVREEAGQTTVEWLVIMVGLVALGGALAAAGVWGGVVKSITGEFSDIIGKVLP
jgi:Flp pilus assembly pilin Flp